MDIYETTRETRPAVNQTPPPMKQSAETALARLIREKMENISLPRCICRIGDKLDQESSNTLVPKLVSIGPYHYANESLKVMEEHKWHYSFTLLSRKPNLEARLDKCVKGLRELERGARICYADELNLTSDEFVEIILIDGCFVIEVLMRYGVKGLRRRGDPFFGRPGKISGLRLDMLMLENQIPLNVLQMLFSLAPIPEQCTTQSLNELAFAFFKSVIPGDHVEKFGQYGYHFLDMIRDQLLPVSQKLAPRSSKLIKSATNLDKSGLVLKESTEQPGTLLDVKFAKGYLAIPQLKIQPHTETLLRNLIGYEQCVGGSTALYVTSYAFLMQHLMRSEEDVELLEKHDIVRNYLGDRKGAVDMFKRVCNGIDLKQNLYGELCEQVNGYERKSWFEGLRTRFL
uniref:Uncharacterized protein n=1 Tax=Kalanchoe fedtschenkoi TaxID=63787 RepID=A0A7N0T748_KALFE